MAEKTRARASLMLLLLAFPDVFLVTSTGNASSIHSAQEMSTPSPSEDHHASPFPLSTPGLDGQLSNVSGQDVENASVELGPGNSECLEAAADDASLCTNATSPGQESEGGLGKLALINSGSVSAQTYDAVARITNYCSVPLILVGSVLNGFSVAVYVQPAMRSASSTYLAALCLVELVYLLLSIFTVMLNILLGSQAVSNYVSLAIGLYIGIYVQTVTRRLTFALTFIVCLERLLAVAFPLKYKQRRCGSRPARVVVICAVLIALVHFDVLAKLDIVPIGNGKYGYKQTPFFVENRAVLTTYATIFRFVFVYAALLGTVAVNVLTTVVMRRHRQAARKLTTNRDAAKDDKADRQTTLAILVSSFVFVLFSLPVNINSLLQEFLPHYGFLAKEHFLYLTVQRLCPPLELMSSFLDYFSYMILSRRFRSTFLKMVCGRCRRSEGKKVEGEPQQTQTTDLSSSVMDTKT